MTLTFTVKADYNDDDEDALLQESVTFPDTADSIAGTGTLFIPHTSTEDLVLGQRVYYDFQLTYVDDDAQQIVNTLDSGSFKVDWDVTRTVAE